jgi:DNA-binding transcriptional regulator of glucitol operon
MKTIIYQHKRLRHSCAGGGIRTLTLSRAPAPKAGMSAIPSRPRARKSYRCARPRRLRWPPRTLTTWEYLLGVSTTHRRRPALIVLALLAASGCLALGWWQWTRFQSASGSFQNLGYALQWPAFAGFCVYAYYKFVRYEDAPPEPRETRFVTEIPDGLLPERPKSAQRNADDAALLEYNTYLAELAKADNENQRRQNRTTA